MAVPNSVIIGDVAVKIPTHSVIVFMDTRLGHRG